MDARCGLLRTMEAACRLAIVADDRKGLAAQATRRVVEAVLQPSQWTIGFMTTTLRTIASTSTARRRCGRGKRRVAARAMTAGPLAVLSQAAEAMALTLGVGSIVLTGVPATATSHRAREGMSVIGSDATAEDAAFVGSATAGGRITYR